MSGFRRSICCRRHQPHHLLRQAAHNANAKKYKFSIIFFSLFVSLLVRVSSSCICFSCVLTRSRMLPVISSERASEPIGRLHTAWVDICDDGDIGAMPALCGQAWRKSIPRLIIVDDINHIIIEQFFFNSWGGYRVYETLRPPNRNIINRVAFDIIVTWRLSNPLAMRAPTEQKHGAYSFLHYTRRDGRWTILEI